MFLYNKDLPIKVYIYFFVSFEILFRDVLIACVFKKEYTFLKIVLYKSVDNTGRFHNF